MSIFSFLSPELVEEILRGMDDSALAGYYLHGDPRFQTVAGALLSARAATLAIDGAPVFYARENVIPALKKITSDPLLAPRIPNVDCYRKVLLEIEKHVRLLRTLRSI